MLGGHGSIQHMRNAIKANEALLGKRIRLFDRGKRFSDLRQEYVQASKGRLESKEITKEELANIRLRILKRRNRQLLISLAFWALSMLMVSSVIYYNRERLFANHQSEVPIVSKENKKKEERYRFCIEDGDKWLKRNHWHNAIFQYEAALKLFPESWVAKNRLAVAYTYRCRAEKVDCQKAKEFIDIVLIRHPDNHKSYELLASYYFGIGDTTNAKVALSKAELLMERTQIRPE